MDDKLYKDMLDNMYEGVYYVDRERKITFWNKGAERITGFSADEILGKHCFDNILNHVDHKGKQLCINGCPLHATIVDGEPRENGVYLHHKDGHRVLVNVRTIPIKEEDKIVGAVEVFVDDQKVTSLQNTISELQNLALYDQLTEMPNRRYIDSMMSRKMKDYEELGIPFAIIMIDIDHFKNFNDTYGHQMGDQVLRMVAKTLSNAFRQGDFVGRWGGEEFMALVSGVNSERLATVAERVRMLVEKSVLRQGPEELKVTVSVGATLVKATDDAKTMVERADEALYKSKDDGRNRVTLDL